MTYDANIKERIDARNSTIKINLSIAFSILLILFLILDAAAQDCEMVEVEPQCDLFNPLTWGGCIIGIIMNGLNCVVLTLISAMTSIILMRPQIELFRPYIRDIVSILYPVYMVAIAITGIYIIFLSTTPEHRAQAKSMLLKMLFSSVAVTLSMDIYIIIVNLAESISRQILAGWIFGGAGGALLAVITVILIILSTTIALGIISLTVLPIIALLALLSLSFRYLMVCLFCVLFPITLFLYFFDLTKDIGTNLMRYTMAIIFTQPMQALILVIMIITLNNTNTSDILGAFIAAIIAVGCFVLLAFAPLAMLNIIQWVGGAIAGAGILLTSRSPQLGGFMATVGGIASGMGPEALVAGGGIYTLGKTYHRHLGEPEPTKLGQAYREYVKEPIKQKIISPGRAIGKKISKAFRVATHRAGLSIYDRMPRPLKEVASKVARLPKIFGAKEGRGITMFIPFHWVYSATKPFVKVSITKGGGGILGYGVSIKRVTWDFTYQNAIDKIKNAKTISEISDALDSVRMSKAEKMDILRRYRPEGLTAKEADELVKELEKISLSDKEAAKIVDKYIKTGDFDHIRDRIKDLVNDPKKFNELEAKYSGRPLTQSDREKLIAEIQDATRISHEDAVALKDQFLEKGNFRYIQNVLLIYGHNPTELSNRFNFVDFKHLKNLAIMHTEYKRAIEVGIPWSVSYVEVDENICHKWYECSSLDSHKTSHNPVDRAMNDIHGYKAVDMHREIPHAEVEHHVAEKIFERRNELLLEGYEKRLRGRELSAWVDAQIDLERGHIYDHAVKEVAENITPTPRYKEKVINLLEGEENKRRIFNVQVGDNAAVIEIAKGMGITEEELAERLGVNVNDLNNPNVTNFEALQENAVEAIDERVHELNTQKTRLEKVSEVAFNIGLALTVPGYAAVKIGGSVIGKMQMAQAEEIAREISNIQFDPLRRDESIAKLRELAIEGGMSGNEFDVLMGTMDVRTDEGFNKFRDIVSKAVESYPLADRGYRDFADRFFEDFKPAKNLDELIGKGHKLGLDEQYLEDLKDRYNGRVAALGEDPKLVLSDLNKELNDKMIDEGVFKKRFVNLCMEHGATEYEANAIYEKHFNQFRNEELDKFHKSSGISPSDVSSKAVDERNKINAEALDNVHRVVSWVVNTNTVEEHVFGLPPHQGSYYGLWTEEVKDKTSIYDTPHPYVFLTERQKEYYKKQGLPVWYPHHGHVPGMPDTFSERSFFALDLGTHLHGKMMFEDFLGSGPRPSEFYTTWGPETREKKKKRQEEEKKSLYDSGTSASKTLAEVISDGLSNIGEDI